MSREIQYFYIAENDGEKLCGGMTRSSSSGYAMSKFPVWRNKGNYKWARRFTSVENAVKYANDNGIANIHIIDGFGQTVHNCNNRSLDKEITGVV